MTAASDAQKSLQDDNSYQTVIVIVLTMVLANSAVLLRLLARRTMKLSLMADDYMAVLAAVRETRIPFISFFLSFFRAGCSEAYLQIDIKDMGEKTETDQATVIRQRQCDHLSFL